MSKEKLGELIVEAFNGNEGPIRTVSDWYRDLDAATDDVPQLVQLSDGKSVCPGSPKTCLWAGWCPGFERFCDSCPYQLRCFSSPNGLPLTDPVIVKGLTVPEDPAEYSENSENA